jgi:hypothetical protein
MNKTYTVPADVADNITKVVLKEHRDYLKKELKQHKKGEWMHPEDVVLNKQLIDAMEFLLKRYFND